jgi:hypothetical protein
LYAGYAFNVPLTLACAQTLFRRSLVLAPVTPVSCMMRIKPRFYSTSGDNNFSNNSNSNSKTEIFILSSIYEGEKFMSELKTRLSCLKKSSSYKLEFCLYLNTNDENKELDFTLGNYYSVFIFIDQIEIFKNLTGIQLLDEEYEYKGYYIVHSDLFTLELIQDLDKYIRQIYKLLGEYVEHTNERLDCDEFVEFKKSTVLKITKINKSNNSTLSEDIVKDKSNNFYTYTLSKSVRSGVKRNINKLFSGYKNKREYHTNHFLNINTDLKNKQPRVTLNIDINKLFISAPDPLSSSLQGYGLVARDKTLLVESYKSQ